MSFSSRFRVITSGEPIESVIVAIPGVGTPSVDDWDDDANSTWLKCIPPTAAPKKGVLTYDHGLDVENFTWQGLIEHGRELLSGLLDLELKAEWRNRPIILVCHSLGGLVVKQALSLAHSQTHVCRGLLNGIAGVIFLGTPHIRDDDETAWKNCTLILRTISRSGPKATLTHDDSSHLADVCRRFDHIHIQIPIISIYETQETKMRQGLKTKRLVLVPSELAKTNARNEISYGADTKHVNLCKIRRSSQVHREIMGFIGSAIEDITKATNEFSIPAADQSTNPLLSIEAEQAIADDDLISGPTPVKATNGSTGASYEFVSADNLQLVSGLVDFPSPKRIARLPCLFNLPLRNPAFVSRRDTLASLEEALLPSDPQNRSPYEPQHLKTFVICGPGGMGKTQIAGQFALSNQDKFDAVFWLHADETAKLYDGFTKIAIQLGLENASDAKDQVISRDLVKGWLANPTKQGPASSDDVQEASWLIIFDNADRPEVLNEFWPIDGGGSVLATSRNPTSKSDLYFSNTRGEDLQPLPANDAAEWLDGLVHETNERNRKNSALKVANRLGGIPLAITQMAAQMNRQFLSFAAFLELYDEEESIRELHHMEGNSHLMTSTYCHTLATVWNLEKLEHGISLLDVLSLLDPDGADETILRKGASQVALDDYPKGPGSFQKARLELINSSLVSRDQDELIVHRVIQDAARSKMSTHRLQSVFEATVHLVLSAWPVAKLYERHQVQRWSQCETIFPHVLCLRRLYSAQSRHLSLLPSFAHLLNEAGWYHHERGNSDDSKPFFGLAQFICEQFLMAETTDVGKRNLAEQYLSDIHYSRGAVATETNEPVACIMHYQALLDVRERVCRVSGGQEDLRLAVSHNEMGIAYMLDRNYGQATEFFNHALRIYKKLPDFSQEMTSLAQANLGLAHWLQGQHDIADEILSQALQVRKDLYGIDDRESFKTGRLLYALGNVRASRNLLDDSFNFHHRALAQFQATIGHNHHRTADVCFKVAEHWIERGKELDSGQSQKALTFLNQAMKVYERRKCYNPEKARTCFKKGAVLLHLNDYSEGRQYIDIAVQLYRNLVPGDDRPSEELRDCDFDVLVAFWSR